MHLKNCHNDTTGVVKLYVLKVPEQTDAFISFSYQFTEYTPTSSANSSVCCKTPFTNTNTQGTIT